MGCGWSLLNKIGNFIFQKFYFYFFLMDFFLCSLNVDVTNINDIKGIFLQNLVSHTLYDIKELSFLQEITLISYLLLDCNGGLYLKIWKQHLYYINLSF